MWLDDMWLNLKRTPTSYTYLVEKNGNDANTGKELLSWLTFQKASKPTVAGNTVCVKAGKYNERIIPQTSGYSGNWIVFSVAPGMARYTVIINGAGITITSLEGLVSSAVTSNPKFVNLFPFVYITICSSPGINADHLFALQVWTSMETSDPKVEVMMLELLKMKLPSAELLGITIKN